MCKKLIYLISFILTMSVVGKASGDLVLHWPLYGNAIDLSINGYNGTVGGTANYIDGNSDLALDFDGGNPLTTTLTVTIEKSLLFTEDFEGLALGPNIDEALAGDAVWTETPPEGWSVDESGIPGIGLDSTDGVTEWAGWAFTDKEWWMQAAGDQKRSEFTFGQGTVAVADPDEWDDGERLPVPISADPYDTWLTTPAIYITGIEAGTLELKFDSSWRPEFDHNYHQTANITASFDGGDPVEVLLWESDEASANFHPYATNETVVVDLDSPADARSVVLTFGLFDAGNDWWWAIDNIEVCAVISGVVPFNPYPKDGGYHADSWATLFWPPGIFAASHDIYFGDNFDDVNDGLGGTFQGNQTETSFNVGLPGGPYPDGLVLDTTYYWRVDEVKADGTTVHKGDVWSFTTVDNILSEPLDSVLSFSTGGDEDWLSQTAIYYRDGDAAQSGGITDDQESWLQTVVYGAGIVSFFWKVSSEGNYDCLEFYIDGTLQNQISGSEDWHEMTYEITGSTLHRLEWRYFKDGSMDRGDDCGWVDKVVWTPAP